MNFPAFKAQFEKSLVVPIVEIKKLYPSFDTKALVRWQKQGYIIKVKNGFYTFANRQYTTLDLYRVANLLYTPSYISLQSALSFYSIIPEAVISITSISTNKTTAFTTPLAHCMYQSVKKKLFFGYQLLSHPNGAVRMANPEKAVLDYLYLNPAIKKIEDIEALRWNIPVLQQLNWPLLTGYLQLTGSRNLYKKTGLLKKYCHA